jgi:hypothetical protein
VERNPKAVVGGDAGRLGGGVPWDRVKVRATVHEAVPLRDCRRTPLG